MVYPSRYRRRRISSFRTRSRTVTNTTPQGTVVSRSYRSRRLANKGVHFFKRTVVRKLDVNPTVLGQVYFTANDGVTANDYQLNYIPNVNEITTLFDLYKINGVKTKFIFDRNEAQSSTALNTSLPTLYMIRDFDDGTPAGALTDMQQYESLKMKRLDKPVSIFVKPKISQMVYKSAVGTAYSTPKRNPWLDCAQSDVPHYGLKWAVDTNSIMPTSIGTLTVMQTYYISCRDVR